MNRRIGVYICHCGSNISDYVDVDRIKEAVEGSEGIVIAKTTIFACSDSSQKEMIGDIREHHLDGIVVASCSPKLHLLTFRAVAERAGINKYNYVHANIREQASWAHSDNKEGATEKAILTVRSAIARVLLSEALTPFSIPSEKAVAVIGAGVAGMKAAIELADMGCPVTLIEKEHFTGGRVAQWDSLFPTGETGKEITTELYNRVLQRDNIILMTGTEVISGSGCIGSFKLSLNTRPRYFKEPCNRESLTDAVAACPVSISDEFNFGLTSRKAIYHTYPGVYPQNPVIDIENCTRCGECEKNCDSIDFSQEEKLTRINVGSILVATGFDPYIPAAGEYGYNSIANVITLPQFIRIIGLNKGKLEYEGREIRKIAYIYCVGSRQTEGVNKYCSRYCCTSAINAALLAKKKFVNIENFHFTRGIRTYGKQEVLYNEALETGDIFLQSYLEDPPSVSLEDGQTIIRINDVLSGKREISLAADLVVLVTGMVKRSGDNITSILKIPRGRDNFFNEIHMKLRPVETVIDGITICGAAQGPKNISESVSSALSAAVKSYSYVSNGVLELDPVVALIDKSTCTWCGACMKACPYDAVVLQKDGDKDYASINNPVCKGCGMCLPVCPTDAIELISYSNREIESMIDALSGNMPNEK